MSDRVSRAQSSPLHSDLDFASGLTLLTVRPQLLLSSMHELVLYLGLRLSSMLEQTEQDSAVSAQETSSAPMFSQDRWSLASETASFDSPRACQAVIQDDLLIIHQIMEKTKHLENKVNYQVKKLVNLATAAEKEAIAKNSGSMQQGDGDEGDEDALSFKPNVKAILSAKSSHKANLDEDEGESSHHKRSIKNSRRSPTPSEDESDGNKDGIYRPPRLGAIPYNEGSSEKRSRRAERKAPALLSEFADSLTSAPVLESTSGLSVRPVGSSTNLRSNSTSAKRLAELQRMTEFEEENMTRLVMKKRDAKRREEDEEALLMGYGVGGEQRSRSRRQGGFEAELEGVLGNAAGGGQSKSMWDDVGRGNLAKRDSMLERSRKRDSGEDLSARGGGGGNKKRRFEKSVKKHKR